MNTQPVAEATGNQQTHFLCEICSNSYTRRSTLTNHMRSHTGERPYRCQLCDERFMSADSLRSHGATHSSTRFSCSRCHREFSRVSSLKRHQSSTCLGLGSDAAVQPISVQESTGETIEISEESHWHPMPNIVSETLRTHLEAPESAPTVQEPSNARTVGAIRANRWIQLFQSATFSQKWYQDAWWIAADEGCSVALKSLLQVGVEVNSTRNNSKDTALHIVSRKGHLDSVCALLDMHAMLDVQGYERRTPLYEAVEENRFLVVQELVYRGANPVEYCGDHYRGQTPLALAATRAETEILQCLFDHVKDPFLPRDTKPLIHRATASKGSGNLLFLLSGGADIRARDAADRTVLQEACFNRNSSCVEVILNMSDFVQASPRNFRSAFWDLVSLPTCGQRMCYQRSTADISKCTKLLVTHGADINELDNDGNTLLMGLLASYFVNDDDMDEWAYGLDCLSVLLENGAGPNLIDPYGDTVLDHLMQEVDRMFLNFDVDYDEHEVKRLVRKIKALLSGIDMLLDDGAMKGEIIRERGAV